MTIHFRACGHEQLGPLHLTIDGPCPVCLPPQAERPESSGRFWKNDGAIQSLDPAVQAAAQTLSILLECWMKRMLGDDRVRSVVRLRTQVMPGTGEAYFALVAAVGKSPGPPFSAEGLARIGHMATVGAIETNAAGPR